MTKDNQEKLFDKFSAPKEEDWYDLAKKEMKMSDLSWKTYENLVLKPIYTEKDLKEIEDSRLRQCGKLSNKADWFLIESVLVKDQTLANIQAITALEGGADGVHFSVEAPLGIDHLLKNIWVDNCFLFFDLQKQSLSLVSDLFNFYKNVQRNPEGLQGGVSYDPLRDWMISGNENLEFPQEIAELARLSFDYPNFSFLTVNSHHIVNSGGNVIQELSYLLSVFVEYIEGLKNEGIGIKRVLENTLFSLTVSTNFFFEISKLRALGYLISKIAATYNIPFSPSQVKIHSCTSLWTKSHLDFYNNIIRSTGEAMAATIGGTNYLSIIHLSRGVGEQGSDGRTLRNISHILKEEAFMGKVIDPPAGSYYIESLTYKIQEEAWKEFLNIEKAGGFIEALKKGVIASEIDQVQAKKLKNLDLRRDLMIGVNVFPNSKDQIETVAAAPVSLTGKYLGQRAAMEIEEMRLWVNKELVKQNGVQKNILIANLSSADFGKPFLSLVKATFLSAGLSVEFGKSDFDPSSLVENYQLLIILIDVNSEEELNKFTMSPPLINKVVFTSEVPLEVKEKYQKQYCPIEELVRAKVLRTILEKSLNH